jgi:chorismate mutase/prephenate dehydratase
VEDMIDMTHIKESRKTDFPQAATVACQGVPGAYSQRAANSLFRQPDIIYMRTFDGVFRAVDSGLCKYGILPVENSTAGSVTTVYDLMNAYKFYIVRSVKISVSHFLLSNKKVDIKNIKELYTHEQAAAQCGKVIEENPHIELKLCGNTATAAKIVAESGRNDIAAIDSESCAELYNLTVLKNNLQGNKNNYTRFICISKSC